MSDQEKRIKIREVDRRIPTGDKIIEKGARVISQGPANPPPPPATPSASAGAAGSTAAPAGGKD